MTQTRKLLTDKDRMLLESLVYDPGLEPRFNALRSYLTWEDELPSGITPDGLDTLANLWIARACLYHGFELPDLFDSNYFSGIWNQAIAEKLDWPGFKRLTLSDENKEFYKQKLNQENPFD